MIVPFQMLDNHVSKLTYNRCIPSHVRDHICRNVQKHLQFQVPLRVQFIAQYLTNLVIVRHCFPISGVKHLDKYAQYIDGCELYMLQQFTYIP
jgi:hypothetical protein